MATGNAPPVDIASPVALISVIGKDGLDVLDV